MSPGDVTEMAAKAICETIFGLYDPEEADRSIHSPSGQAREAAKAAIEQVHIWWQNSRS